jgi:hypothetical protein
VQHMQCRAEVGIGITGCVRGKARLQRLDSPRVCAVELTGSSHSALLGVADVSRV